MENALVLIKKAKDSGALAYIPQNLECPPLYKVEASVVEVSQKDFHDKEVNGKILPRKELVDKIGDAAGISFIQLNNELSVERLEAEPALDLPARSVFVGRSQGKVRLSDGSWRTSTVEICAFDYVARAYSEESEEYKRKRKLNEYYKAGPMRAASGARLRVIRQLTGVPNGFDPKEIQNCHGKLVFSRIVQNTDYILGTPEGKMMAIAMATGAAQMLYGNREQIQGKSADIVEEAPEYPPMRSANEPDESPASIAAEALDDAFTLDPEPTQDVNPEIAGLISTLTDYIATNMLPKEGARLIQEALDGGERRPEELRKLVDRAKTAYDAVMARRKAAASGKTA